MIHTLLGLALFLLQSTGPGTMEGIVLSAATGEPVAGAQVTLIQGPPGGSASGGFVIGGAGGGVIVTELGTAGGILAPRTAPPGTPVPTPPPQFRGQPGVVLTTGADGRFSFKDVSAGSYRIIAMSNGYVRQEYGQRVPSGQGTRISLAAGANLKDLTIRLTPAGVVTGRISDESGQPAVDIPVQLLRVVYTPFGREFQSVGTGNANDRGEYRLYGITPGQYYLHVGTGPGPIRRPGQPGPFNQTPPTIYAVSFYPGVDDMNQASLVEVKSGAEITADMRVNRQHTYRVSGRIIDSRTGRPPQGASITLNYRTIGSGGSGGFGSPQNYKAETGTFELQNVIPGQYTVEARIQEAVPQRPAALDAAAMQARAAAAAAQPSARVPIHITNADIDGLVLTITTPASVQGRLIVEGGSAAALTNLNGIRLVLRPAPDSFGLPMTSPPYSSQLASDGTFRVENLREGVYAASIFGVPPGHYIKTIRLAGAEGSPDAFRFSGSTSGLLDIVLSPRAARITGVVTDPRNLPVQAVQAVLVPAERSRSSLYKMAVTDQNGSFTIADVPPGDYKLFGWEAIDPFGYLDPDFVKKFESLGRSIRVDESSTQTVDLKVIPATAGQ
jgi:hypothetical protein